jgi:SAM-dependent methyltransferase
LGVIGGKIADRILKRFGEGGNDSGNVYEGHSKLEVLLGSELWDQIRDRTVIDFGCGLGAEAVELAQRGAKRVIGLDIQQSCLEQARIAAQRAGVADRCTFSVDTTEKADVIISLDSFEHFEDPAAILDRMKRLLNPGGRVIASFGYTWYHPYGGHLFSVFPWAHLIFTEQALIRWRSRLRNDGATRFSEVAGGLNQMTIKRFEKIVANSPFEFERIDLKPIKRLAPVANRITREWTTSNVVFTLIPRRGPGTADPQ